MAELARKKHLPEAFLTELGLSDNAQGIGITYRLSDGTTGCRQRLRVGMSAKDGFRWLDLPQVIQSLQGPCRSTSNRLDPSQVPAGSFQNKQIKPLIVPYGLWRLKTYAEKYIILVEGETDSITLWFHRFPALGLPGATTAKTIKPDYLVNFETIYIWQEPDKAGQEFVSGLNKRLFEIGWPGVAKVVSVEGYKDPSEIHIADAKEFKKKIRYALALARPLPAYIPPAPKPKPLLNKNYGGKLTAEKVKIASEYPLEKLVEAHNGYIICPFHGDTRPSMWVKNGFGWCFSCGEKMNSIVYLRKVKGMKFDEAVNYLVGAK